MSTRPDRSPPSSRNRTPGGRAGADCMELELGSSGGIPASRQQAGKTPPECQPPDLSGSRSRPLPRCSPSSPSAPAPAPTPTPVPPAPSQRGPLNENYDPPIYPPTARAVYQGTPANPLVRPWGVYQGLAEHAWLPYLGASEDQKALLDKIVQRPEGDLVRPLAAATATSSDRVEKYIELTTGGDPEVLVQISIFRMEPWEARCLQAAADGGRAGVVQDLDRRLRRRRGRRPHGDHHAAGRALRPVRTGRLQAAVHLIRYGVRTLSALPNTSVYIDAGAADWHATTPMKGAEDAASRRVSAGPAGSPSTAPTTTRPSGRSGSPRRSPRRWPSAACPASTASSTPPRTAGPSRATTYNGQIFDNARLAPRRPAKRCVTLGIPPTVDVADPKWGHEPRTTAASPSGTSTPTCGSDAPGSTTRPRRSCWTGPSRSPAPLPTDTSQVCRGGPAASSDSY